ncbi:hypothetical protein M0D69_02855 [Caballeronia sp. SEWSISQ10-4 2]|uniref:hypothetical protein n=1 Tax=Caballeronia sp. SEWSISQ10-4 2 TaxID=2937438 RepID=UPI00264E4E78|nr:hypothetical protein [Caballeronia sp. SEWSISQ10-4 2]MDN7176974.1 hypothetical protein [Caballeronia sp. SEWSISQ10-4 2]
MAAISSFDGNGPATILASPIFVVKERADEIEFEVLEIDADALRSQLGVDTYFIVGSEGARWARLISLDSCQSVALGLRLLRDRPILKGVLKIHPPEAVGSH